VEDAARALALRGVGRSQLFKGDGTSAPGIFRAGGGFEGRAANVGDGPFFGRRRVLNEARSTPIVLKSGIKRPVSQTNLTLR
jgi:hypothetical protein